jgi:Alkaline phosphatase PhoX
MPKSWTRSSLILTCLASLGLTLRAAGADTDFGAFVAAQLRAHSLELFGFTLPLDESALGPYTGADSTQALVVAHGLTVSLVSSAVHHSTDQIALWPDDDHPTHLFVCDEESTNPAVQRVDLSMPPNNNATTIVTGLDSCDPVRRTPWGTIIVAEEAGQEGGLYELIDPVHITGPVQVNRDTGVTSDPLHVVKRRAVGSLSFESFAIRPDGTTIYGDELAPSGGRNGGAIYKFVPAVPFTGGPPITVPSQSPFVSGNIFGLHVGRNNNSGNWGQGAETGKGRWTAVNLTLTHVQQPDGTFKDVVESDGDINLGVAQQVQLFTGYYRPEDMDIDPIAAANGVFRACWANTGRMSNGFGSLVETGGVNSEVMCLVEEPSTAPTGFTPIVSRFVPGNPTAQMYDNVAFQPHTGNLVILEDGPVNVVVGTNPTVTQRRGNDLWICLPDGADDDTQTDGCVRFGSLMDTTSEPTGFIFLGSGEEAFVSLQHRSVDEAGQRGSLMKISGFKVAK